jgi:hypothetical protein
MTPRLLAFIRLLRRHGLRISVAEGLDGLQSVNCVGLQERDLLRLGLRTALVKSRQDFATFDTLFERFFTVARPRKRRRAQEQPSASDDPGQHTTPPAHSDPVQPPHQPLTLPTPPTSTQHQSRQDDPHTTEQEHTQSQAPDLLAELERAWQQRLDVQPQRVPANTDNSVTQTQLDREFPPGQLADMYHEVERLAARLLTRRALRYRRARRGQFDLRRTVLHGLRNGLEVPFTQAYRRHHMSKLRLVVLCDVSGSVWQVSTFLLKLVHTLQAEFASVRSFLFVNSVVEVTPLFRHMRFPQDLDALRHYPNLNLFGFSDFGRTFYQFYQDFLLDLSRDTVLIVLGDARNNYFDPQAWTLGEVRQRCRRLIWLNPEPRRAWNTSDSVLAAYTPFCDYVLECWTLTHLGQAADLLLRT